MNMKILIADRDRNNRTFIKEIINSIRPCQIKEVDKVIDLVNSTVNEVQDLLIIDINIQSQNYEKLLEIIRAANPKEKLPIVVITYAMEKEKIISLLKLGINDLILKPLLETSVAEKLKGLLVGFSEEEASEIITQPAEPDGSRKRFLLVDHDRTFMNLFNRLFADDFDIRMAENGEEGLKLFLETKPDYVFIAEQLKLINERLLVQKMRSFGLTDIKIYFLSTVLKSSSMKSTQFNGVIEKTYDLECFRKEFAKIVWGEEPGLYPKISRMIRNVLPSQMSGIIKSSFENIIKEHVSIYSNTGDLVIANESLASVELIDEKKELSVTVGLYGSGNDMLLIAEKIIGEPVTMNTKAIEAIGGLITDLGSGVSQFILKNGVKLLQQDARVNTKLENKLKYDWDLAIPIKGTRNEHYMAGVYCTRYIN